MVADKDAEIAELERSLIQCARQYEKIKSMLERVLDEIEYQEPGIVLHDDVIEWNKNRER